MVNQLRKRVGKTVWPSSTRTRLSILHKPPSTTTEDTDEYSENKLPLAGELVAEVGTDERESFVRSPSESVSEKNDDLLFKRNLTTIDESVKQSHSQPTTSSIWTSANFITARSRISSHVSGNGAEVDPAMTATPSKYRPVSTGKDPPTNKSSNQMSFNPDVNHHEQEAKSSSKNSHEKLRSLESLRKTISLLRSTLQEANTPHRTNTRQGPGTPTMVFSYWCQPAFTCTEQAAEHIFPIDDLSIGKYSSSHTFSTSGGGRSRQPATSFFENVLDRIVGQDTLEESTTFGTVEDSAMDDSAVAESMIFSANMPCPSDVQVRGNVSNQPAMGRPNIMETLKEWDNLDDELGKYNPGSKPMGRSLSIEFSDEESWGYTDDDSTVMTEPSASTSH